MPIMIPNGLPAAATLAEENIFVMNETRAVGATALLEIADEPHLHFAVYANGDTIDPAEFIR